MYYIENPILPGQIPCSCSVCFLSVELPLFPRFINKQFHRSFFKAVVVAIEKPNATLDLCNLT